VWRIIPTRRSRVELQDILGFRRFVQRLLGTGLQHIAALTAQIVRTGTAITAIEEPEIHLNYRLQIEFARALRLLAEKGIGPQQIIVTTHSPAFETEAPFFGMTHSEHGPEIHAHPSASAARFLGQGMHHPTGHAPLSYVTSEGLVQLPEFAREILGVRDGGGVVFHGLREGHVEVVNDQTYFAELGLDAADESA